MYHEEAKRTCCFNLPQYCFVLSCLNIVHVLFAFCFLHILIVTYDSTHAICYSDCNWRPRESLSDWIKGKIILSSNFAWALEVG